MIKILRLGDPHVRPSNIDESDNLLSFVCDKALEYKVDRIEILGDLFHTHAVLRLEVLEFWKAWLDTLNDICPIYVLVGNHDQSGDFNSHSNALSIFSNRHKKNLHIVENAMSVGPIGYMAYTHDKKRFIELAMGLKESGVSTLVCHQTFAGSQYENGFFAPDGINPDEVPFDTIISGHIHAAQRFGKVIYPGTARWDSVSDANEIKGIWIFEHDDTGKIVGETMIPTNDVCAPIMSFIWREGEEQPSIPENSKSAIELIGSSDWISQQKIKFKGKVSIKTKITDKTRPEHRKTGTGLEDFIRNMFISNTDKDKLINYMKELDLV